MNVHDILADRQLAMMQTRKKISIGQNPQSNTAPREYIADTATNQVYQATRNPPLPPFALAPSNADQVPLTEPQPRVQQGHQEPELAQARYQYPKHPYPRPQPQATGPSDQAQIQPQVQPQVQAQLQEEEIPGIGVPGAKGRNHGKVAVGPNGKPYVQPQTGSKEDLRRRKAQREERERMEASRRAQSAMTTSPTSWYTASSNTATHSPHHLQVNSANASGHSNSSASPPCSGSSSTSQKSALSFAVRRTSAQGLASLIVPPRQGSLEGSIENATGERRRSSYTSLVSKPNHQPGLIVEEDEDDEDALKTPTPPEIKLEKEKALARMMRANGLTAEVKTVAGSSDSEGDEAVMNAAVIVRRAVDGISPRERDQSTESRFEQSRTGEEAGSESKSRNSTDTVVSQGYLTMTGTDTDGSLKTPTTAEFRNQSEGCDMDRLGDEDKKNDSSVSIPTIVSSSADDEPSRKDSTTSELQALIKGLPAQLGQRARIVSDIGKRLSIMGISGFMSGKGDIPSPLTPGGSRRPSFASAAGSEFDGDGIPSNAMGRAVHQELWKPDHLSTECDFISCHTEFTFRIRKHHCRFCGGIFCDVHSNWTLPLYYPPVEQDEDEHVSGDRGNRSNRSSSINLTALGAKFNGGVANSRVCETCYEKVAHPEKLLARRAAAKGVKIRPLLFQSNKTFDLPSSDEEEDSDDDEESFEDYKKRKQQRLASKAPARRMFSAPVTPLSTSPPRSAVDGSHVINSSQVSPRTSFRQNSRVRSAAGSRSQSRAHSRSGTMLSRQASITSAARKAFSPTVEALNPNSCSPGEGVTRNGYFPAVPPPGMPHLPGEEPNQTVSGVLASYPLAHKTVTSPSSFLAPHAGSTTSLLSLGSLVGPGRPVGEGSSRDSSRSRSGLTISNMPPLGMGALDQIHAKLHYGGQNGTSTQTNSSAGLLTPDREWVPSAWGYDRQTFDPEIEPESDEEVEDGKRGRSRLIVDGDFRFKANPHVVDDREATFDTEEYNGQNEEQRFSTSLAWATF